MKSLYIFALLLLAGCNSTGSDPHTYNTPDADTLSADTIKELSPADTTLK